MSNQLEHTIIFEGEITKKNVQNLIDYINSYSFVNLYFSTVGGRLDMMRILVDFLNHRYEKGTLKLTLYDFVASAGTLILVDYSGPIFVKDLRGFLFHAPDLTLNIVRKDKWQKAIEEQLHKHNEYFYEDIQKLGLTKSEINKIKQGEDIYIFEKDFSRIKRDLFVAEETLTNHYVIQKS